jgi:FkbM family methyltransferase
MTFKDWAKRKVITTVENALPRAFHDRLIRHYGIPSTDWSLRNARNNGFNPEVIIDIGAYTGEWSRMANRIFKGAGILAIEAQREKENDLSALAREHQNIEYKIALLGSERGSEVHFRLNETGSSVSRNQDSDTEPHERRMTQTLDHLTSGIFEKPDLIKLDVQGYELEVLRGSKKIMNSHPPELILTEVSLIEVIPGAPLFREVIEFMANRGYRLYDICSFIRRPLDDALWQVDALFVSEESDLVSSRRWESP